MKNSIGVFVRDDVPPMGSKVTPIKKVGAKDRYTVAVCSAGFTGFPTHWFGGRTIPHQHDRKTCPGCVGKAKLSWYGFIHVCSPDGRGSVILEVTREGAKMLLGFQGNRPSLRGLIVHVRRERENLKAPLIFELIGQVQPAVELPPAIDPILTLRVLWGVDDLN